MQMSVLHVLEQENVVYTNHDTCILQPVKKPLLWIQLVFQSLQFAFSWGM